MPITIPNGLPAKSILEDERIFALEEDAAARQDIRPLNIVLLNLMPKKIETETQILRLISKSPLQVHVDFMHMGSHESKNTPADHLVKFYETFDAFRDKRYDGLIVTGAPIEHLPFEEVDYWDELTEVLDWSRENVFSTIHICWGALAGLYHHYGVPKVMLEKKLFGIYPQRLCDEYQYLTNGFDEVFNMPQSRHAAPDEAALAKVSELEVLGASEEAGSTLVVSHDMREIYVTGHFEYGKFTLRDEYERDVAAHKPIELPVNYYPDDDPAREPLFTWRSHANLFWRNWLNYVYQMTPYDLADLSAGYEGYRYSERIWHVGDHE